MKDVLFTEYKNLVKDVNCFPEKSPVRSIYKGRLDNFLKEVKMKYGQEIVDILINNG